MGVKPQDMEIGYKTRLPYRPADEFEWVATKEEAIAHIRKSGIASALKLNISQYFKLPNKTKVRVVREGQSLRSLLPWIGGGITGAGAGYAGQENQ